MRRLMFRKHIYPLTHTYLYLNSHRSHKRIDKNQTYTHKYKYSSRREISTHTNRSRQVSHSFRCAAACSLSPQSKLSHRQRWQMNVGFLLLGVLFAKEMSKIYTVYIFRNHFKDTLRNSSRSSYTFLELDFLFGILPLMGISQTASGNIIVL